MNITVPGNKISLLALTLLLTQTGSAQPDVAFIRTFDNGQGEAFYDLYAISDGGFIACGVSTMSGIGFGGALGDIFIVRTDEDGRVIWSRSYPEQGVLSQARTIIETDGGEFVFGGQRGDQFTAGKINADGEAIWRADYGRGRCEALIELKSDDILMCGSGGGGRIILVNSDGEVIWSRTHENGRSSRFSGMRETEGGAVLAGLASGDVWVAKVELNEGDLVWSRSHSIGRSSSASFSITSAGDGGFALTGYASFQGEDFFLLKVNQNGQQAWNVGFERNDLQEGSAIVRLRDRGFAVVGFTHEGEGDVYRPLAIRTDSQGGVRWTAEYAWEEDERYMSPSNFTSVVRGADDAIYVAGYVVDREDSLHDALIMKLEPDIAGNANIVISPEDTILTVLPETMIDFSVTIEDGPWNDFLSFEWMFNDSAISDRDSCTVLFESLGRHVVECRILQEDLTISIIWHVTVSDFFISSYSPDSLSLALRRGSSQTFSLDSVAAVEGDPVEYQWTVTDLNSFEREDAGSETGATVEFFRSGNYSVEGLAYRGESSDNVIWTIAVRSAILDFWPRSLRLEVPPDSLVNFGVLPFNPESDSLSYRWEVDGELIGQDSAVGWYFAPLDSQAGRLTYAVSVIVMDGLEGDTVAWEVTVREPDQVGKPESPKVEKWWLLSVSPNPFNSSTTIKYVVPAAGRVQLTLHDLTGREIQRLLDDQFAPGSHSINLNGSNLPPGLYFLRLETVGRRSTKKIVLMK